MDIETMSAKEVLNEIARQRRALENIEGELEIAKMDLKTSLQARRVKGLREQSKWATSRLNALLGDVQVVYQPRLNMGEVLDEVAEIINEGALDTDAVTCSAEVSG